MKWTIREVRLYKVEAETRLDAEDIFNDYGPEVSVDEPMVDCGVISRTYYHEGKKP
jgi:hypothetical protein